MKDYGTGEASGGWLENEGRQQYGHYDGTIIRGYIYVNEIVFHVGFDRKSKSAVNDGGSAQWQGIEYSASRQDPISAAGSERSIPSKQIMVCYMRQHGKGE